MKICITNNKVRIDLKDYTLDSVSAYWIEDNTVYNVLECAEWTAEYNQNDVLIKGEYNDRRITWELRNNDGYMTSVLKLESDNELCIEGICALRAKVISSESRQKFLRVPFDNDDWVRFVSREYSKADMGYGVGAIYSDNGALIVGALDYDIWKTGVVPGEYVDVLSGVADNLTRDKINHGAVRGNAVSSPEVYIGCGEAWQEGMMKFAGAYEKHNKRLSWEGAVPFGWNSWYAYMMNIDKASYLGASDFIAGTNFNDKGAAYINFDAAWSKLTEEELIDAAKKVREKGQIPGIYISPFAGWFKEDKFHDYVTYDNGERVSMDGFEDITYYDILLKDYNGEILPPIDGGYPLDVTHPVVIERMRFSIKRLGRLGYEYVKADFLGHGAVEGDHYNKKIQTGMMAYNFAMRYMMDCCIEEGMFISLSIAPLFPGGYGHARRICCDVFQQFKDTEYLLNAVTYGFWQNKRVYEFTDPDHICFNGTYKEAKSRFVSALIGGTLMLMSNDVKDEEQNKRILELISNEELLDIARAHITFIPVQKSIKGDFASVFVSEDKKYAVIFNMEDENSSFDLSDIGFEVKYAEDLFSKKQLKLTDGAAVDLEARDCTVLRICI